jgi:integrase
VAGRRLVIDDFRVQTLERGGGWRSFTIVGADGRVHVEADQFLSIYDGSGTQRTYAHYLVDHLRWRSRQGLELAKVTLRDLERYMGAVGAKVSGPFGDPWRVGKRPYGGSSLATAAACLKGFYLHHAARGVNAELGAVLDRSRLPTRADRRRRLLGHTTQSLPSNPLAPGARVRRRHPKMLPDGARERLLETVRSARDRLVVTWLADGGFRIGELCGLHLVDLHLREGAACGECRSAHVHVCHRPDNPNHARAKTKLSWSVEDATITGGLIKRASPAMIHTYFDYMLTERGQMPVGHGMLLVGLSGADRGRAWAPDAARGMLRRAGDRAGVGRVKPHAFRHGFANAVLDASGGNLLIARDAGGWASTTVVDETYSHVDPHDPAFDTALRTVWGLT